MLLRGPSLRRLPPLPPFLWSQPLMEAGPVRDLKFKKKKRKLNIQKTKIMASGPITSWQIDGETREIVRDFTWGWGPPKSLQMVSEAMKLKDACSLEEKL